MSSFGGIWLDFMIGQDFSRIVFFVFLQPIPLLITIIFKIRWNHVGWWLQQKHIPLINNLVARKVGLFLKVYM